jgi:diaminopimelate epimerase
MLGAALERHDLFPQGANVAFAEVEAPDRIRILIWERGVGPTSSSGTGSCAALVAAASFGGAAHEADVIAPGGAQRVEWKPDNVYLTGWAEVLCEGEWFGQIPRTG